jgi:PIF1-like helicase
LSFEAIDRTLRDIEGEEDKDLLFGGIPCIIGGDFAQTLPVVKNRRRADIVRTLVLFIIRHLEAALAIGATVSLVVEIYCCGYAAKIFYLGKAEENWIVREYTLAKWWYQR